MADLDATLTDRRSQYGDFTGHARISQDLKDVMTATPGWQKLSPDKREALDMIQHKVARILNGDPEIADSWHDIAGYSKLAEDRVNPKKPTGTSDTITIGTTPPAKTNNN